MKKRICFFSGDITRSGGTERVASRVANGLVKEAAYEICFLSLVEQNQEVFYHLDASIPRYRLGDHWIHPGPGYLPLIGKLRKFLKEEKIDIIIDIDIVLDALSIPATKGLGTKVVSWEHFNAEFELSVFYRKCILRYSIQRSDYVVVLTKSDLEIYRQRLGRKDRICQIYNPVEKPMRKENRTRKHQILTIGRLVPEKGMDKLMRVAAAVLTAHPDWQWLLLGEGAERTKLEQFVAENNLQDRLILLGNVTDVDSYLEQASILVCTSVFEGLGMSILEARSIGVPCVSFAVKTGPLEIIQDGVDGFLVPPFDCEDMIAKINLLIQNPSLREQFAQQALISVSEFETEKIIKQWKNILELLTCA